MSKVLETTIAGSLPKPLWLAEPNVLWAPWRLEGDALAEGMADAVRLAVDDQEEAGIDIVTDGEQTRRHFVTTFLEALDGVDFEHRKTVRIRNRYDAAVPVVVGPVARRNPVFADAARFLRSATRRKIKVTLPGPMTLVDTLYDAHYRSREKLASAFAEILNDEARAIEAAGADVIQFDEPAFNVYFDEVRDWGVRTLERAAQALTCTTAVHICYGYGIKANIDWKKTLGREWRQYEQTFPLLAQSADRAGIARVRQFARADRAHRAPQRQGRAGRRHRRRLRSGRDAGSRCGDDHAGAPARADRAALPLHELRGWFPCRAPLPGASCARSRREQPWFAAAGSRASCLRGRGFPPRRSRIPASPVADSRFRRTLVCGPRPVLPPPAKKHLPWAPKTTSTWLTTRVSSPNCFSFKAVSTPCTTALQSFHRRSFLEIETRPGTPDFNLYVKEILEWQLEL
jgi:5-methyltetrahydropteroyltriglutamate--homocysteine methyltransferase